MEARFDGGEAIVEAFRNLGIEYVFSSPGSEWGPVWEAFARQTVGRVVGPRFFNCGHETLAVDLALGYTLATGRMQAVLLHAGSGLMQGSMAIHSALTSGTPLVLMSGECLGYGDDPQFDPGSQWYAYLGVVGGPQRLMEPFVKWAQQAASTATLHDMVVRAGELAQAVPPGPTYLSVTVEALASECQRPDGTRKFLRPRKPQVADAQIDEVAGLLMKARNPVILPESSGREREGYEKLIELAELLAIPVVESPFATVSNFPKQHPLHQGFDPKALLAQADMVLLVRNRVPWYPPRNRPAGATVIVLDEAPFKASMVYQNFQADRVLEGDVPSCLARLCEIVRGHKPDEAKLEPRRTKWTAAHRGLEDGYRSDESRSRESAGVKAVNLCATLCEVLPGETIYVDETTSHRGLIHKHVRNHGHLGFVRSPSGLGQGLGFALGLRLALPDRPVVNLLGDGALLYNPLVPSLAFAAQEKLPLMLVVFNNRAYQSMKRNQLHDYPDGAGAKQQLLYGGKLYGADYDQLANGFGALGLRVERSADLKPALERAYAALREGRTVIVNVLLEA